MLKQRIFTISILIPFFAWLFIYASQEVFLSTTSTIMIIAAFEWLKLLKNNILNNLFNIIIVFLMFLLITKSYWLDPYIISKIMLIASYFWFVNFLIILLYKKCNQTNKFNNFLMVYNYLGCFLALIPCWLAINYMQIYNKNFLLLACLIIIASDLGAYIFGKLLGKHKLTIVSPNKTWEGILGGYLGAMLVGSLYIIFYVYNKHNFNLIFKIIIITNITFIFSVIGDLFESLIKRTSGVKDSGNILPGHGGVLDRIDSFCAGLPLFLMGVLML